MYRRDLCFLMKENDSEREGEQDVDAVCPGVCLEQLGTHREQGEKTETSV